MRARLAALLPAFAVVIVPLGARVAPHARLLGRLGRSDAGVVAVGGAGVVGAGALLKACAKGGGVADDAFRAGGKAAGPAAGSADDAARVGLTAGDDALRARPVTPTPAPAAAGDDAGSLGERVTVEGAQQGAQVGVEQAAGGAEDDEEER